MANYRDRRVGQEILKEVNDILRKKVRDPRVENVTITDVKVTGDLQQATIYYSILSDLASDKQNLIFNIAYAHPSAERWSHLSMLCQAINKACLIELP